MPYRVFCGGYSANAHQFGTSKNNPNEAYNKALSKWNNRAEQPNEPLTLEELKQMDCQPVWVSLGCECLCKVIRGFVPERINTNGSFETDIYFTDYTQLPLEDCGKTWLAYRRPPTEYKPDNFKLDGVMFQE